MVWPSFKGFEKVKKLSPKQLRVLRAVIRGKEEVPEITISALGCFKAKQQLANEVEVEIILEEMVRAGLVKKEEAFTETLIIYYHPTSEGRRLYDLRLMNDLWEEELRR
jgi:DNA-binding MarR family transcriptional regulator